MLTIFLMNTARATYFEYIIALVQMFNVLFLLYTTKMPQSMAYHPLLLIFFLFALEIVMAKAESATCYNIDPGTMAGIIVADLLLTLVIVVITYYCASNRRKKRENADKVYENVRANCKI